TVVAFVVGLRDLLRSDKPQINTGGGPAVVSERVEAETLIVRDQNNYHLLINTNSDRLLYLIRPQFTGDLQKATRQYLTFLYDQYCYLGFKGLGVSDRVPLRLSLLDLYIPLKARLELPHGETWQAEVRVAGRKLSEQKANQARLSKPQPVLDVLKKHAGLILLGDPGAGKSTFLKYLTVQLALGQDLGLGDRLPVLVPLAAYANALEAGDVRLDDFIADYFCQTCGDLPVSEMLRQALEAGRVLVLLDGLDEVKDPGLRVTVVERAMQFYNFHRRSGNKFVITSRIIGYREVRPNADDLIEGTLIDFDDEEIQLFVERWTSALERQAHAAGSQIAGLEAEKEKTELLDSIQHNPGVRKLAANPLLLTILAVMKRQGVTLPERRVELYEQYVKTMLSVWNKARSLTGRSTGKDLDVIQTVRILAPLALWMHEVSPGVGLVKREDLKRKLRAIYAERGEADPEQAANNFLSDVHEHTGLLLERGPGEYGFIHLTFEEYLAGVAIALRGQGNVDTLMANIQPYVGKAAWNEVLLLSLGYLGFVQQLDQVAGEVLDRLTQSGAAAAVILAGDAAADIQNGGLHPDRCRRIQTTLLAVMTGKEPSPLCARAGATLARLGDPRFRPDAFYLPDEPLLGFIHIPAGRFLMGSDKKKDSVASDAEIPQHEVDLGEYYIARYPVTVAQFRAFVEQSGHKPATQRCLDGLPNHPVVNVTWYDALAYCDWLTTQLPNLPNLPAELKRGWRVSLPSEAEWERAARGTDGRVYPWGDEFDPDKANIRETGIGGTSAVGCFPLGASPAGLLDAIGNVWEWTRSLWGKDGQRQKPEFTYPYSQRLQERENLKAGREICRVMRGGSWDDSQWLARCAFRIRYSPDLRHYSVGFRVSLSPL
ncbi:MAG TPA: SUMF1/EgtB/PvdO family nonheme iron enzyme, partial [Anaerolineaceae bacterium]|nr:SUMF1/EgtB/PvdO family nonheme iron enzyme [Anaerolineaceae bacterium]